MSERIKKFFRQFFLINDSPHKVAAGAALGVFLGVFPGTGLAAAIVLSSLFRFNRLATISGALAVNTWSTILIMPLSTTAGGWISGADPAMLYHDFREHAVLGWKNWLTGFFLLDMAWPLIAGFLIVNCFIALTVYFMIILLIKHFKPRNTHLLISGD